MAGKRRIMEKRVKVFKERPTFLEHLQTVNPVFGNLYTACKLQFGIAIFYILVRDSLRERKLSINLSKDVSTLGSLGDWWTFAGVECFLLFGYLLMYTAFWAWVWLRQWLGVVASVFYYTLYGVYVCGSFYVVWSTMDNTAPIPKLVGLIEQLKFSMKAYAFLHENMCKVLHPWNKDDDSGPAVWYAGQMSPQVGSLPQYLYFLFAPTLLYRDHYPMNRNPFAWTNVGLYVVQFLGACLVAKWVLLEFQYPASLRLEDLVESYLKCLLCVPLVLFLSCIIFFNSWCNIAAELTRFGDREFYQNWWSSVGHSEFHRKWNVAIYDFFRTYVHQELGSLMPPRYRPIAALVTFTLSSILHDMYTGITMGFFFPLFIFIYSINGGVILMSGVKLSNFVTYLTLVLGWSGFEILYYIELAARHYCPAADVGKFELRSFYCFYEHNF